MADKARRRFKSDVEPAPPLPSFGDLLLGWAMVEEAAELRQQGSGSDEQTTGKGRGRAAPAPHRRTRVPGSS